MTPLGYQRPPPAPSKGPAGAVTRTAVSSPSDAGEKRVATMPAKTMEGLIAKIALIASGYAEENLTLTGAPLTLFSRAPPALDARALANVRA